MAEMKRGSLKDELFREYDFQERVYRIENPVEVFYYRGGTTHRVVDSDGLVHCVPAPGFSGCVLRWRVRPEAVSPVQW